MKRMNQAKAVAKFQEHKLRGFIAAIIKKNNPDVTKAGLDQLVKWQMEKRQAKWVAEYAAARKAKAVAKKTAKKAK